MRNWAGNVTFGASSIERPKTLAELQDVVRGSGKARVVGSGHSFSRLADTKGTLISLSHMERVARIDGSAKTVTIDGGSTYADIAAALHQAGFGLASVASLPHITVAGATGTATHGSGDTNLNLSSAVSSVTLVTASGDVVSLKRGDADFDGAVVNLGTLGVVAELTLDLVPGFDLRQNIYLDLPVAAVIDNFDAIMSRAYSVSLFTRWQGNAVDQLWIKALATNEAPALEILGARAADRPYHPISHLDGTICTGQMGVPGPWHERLFHFPIGQQASAGAELQSEYFVSRANAPAAFKALHAIQDQIAPALLVSEVRSVAADTLWLSSAYEQDTIGFHFTWKLDEAAVAVAGQAVETALAPFRPRPHWAKVFSIPPQAIRPLYPRMDDFRRLAYRLDPGGKFRNEMIDRLIFDPL